MAKTYIRIKCTAGQRKRRLESEKSICLDAGFKQVTFLPKSQCKIYDLDIEFMPYRWIIEIPEWLLVDNQDLQFAVEQINKENGLKETNDS
jgi:hypothetical protein